MYSESSHALNKSKRIITLLIVVLLIVQALIMFNWGLRPVRKLYGATNEYPPQFSKPMNATTEDILIIFAFAGAGVIIAAVIIIQAKIGMHPLKKLNKKKKEENDKDKEKTENGE